MSESNIKIKDDNIPVFLCGYPKSGTTLLLSLLDRHPELLVLPEESFFLTRIIKHPDRQNINYLLNQTGLKAFQYGKFEFQSGNRDYSNLDFSHYENRLNDLWNKNGNTAKALLESAVLAYGEVSQQKGKKYWVEKTPLNEMYLNDALVLWPNLRAVYIIRDPKDNFCSYKQKREFDSKPFSVNEFITGWRNSINAWETFAASYAKTLLIRYEDLTSSPELELNRLCDFLNIEWDDILLRPTRNGILWTGNSMYGDKFDKISTSSIKKYKALLSPHEIYAIESKLEDIIRRYNYTFDYPVKPIRRVLRKILRFNKQ